VGSRPFLVQAPAKKAAKGAVAKTAKKVKKAKDPNAPKRSMSAFFFFSNENRQEIRDKNPGISMSEVGKKLG